MWYPANSYPLDIEIALSSFAQKPGPARPLVVFAKTTMGQITQKQVAPAARSRIDQAVAPSGRMVTAMPRPRPILICPSADLEVCATASDKAALADAVAKIIPPANPASEPSNEVGK